MARSLLSINNYFYLRGGAEKVFLDHNAMMAELGWQVAPFAMQGSKNLDSEYSDYFINEIEFGEDYSPWQKLRNAAKIIYSSESRHQIARLVQDFEPDIAHAHNIYHHISTSILPELKRRGVPTVLTLHDLKIACPAYTMLSNGQICEACRGGVHHVFTKRCMKDSTLLSTLILIEAWATRLLKTYDCVDRFVVPSQFYIDKFVEWGFPRERFIHIPNYVEMPETEPSSLGERGNYLVYAGRLSREKGLPTLVAAALRTKIPLVIAGTGPVEAEIKAQVEAAGAAEVRFAGYLDRSSLQSLVAGSMGVVVPSEWYENCPMTIIEAYVQGKPVIASDIGGHKEMVTSGETGFKFTTGSAESLATAMRALVALTDSEWQVLSQQAAATARTRYSKEHYRAAILDLYEELLA